MRKYFAAALLGFVGGPLAGCANTPGVTYSYYPAKSSTTLTITQTIDCNADKTAVVTVNTPQATTAYTADLTKDPYTLPIKPLDGWFADADITFKLTEDGRLQSINQSTTGQGETILKSAITFAMAAAARRGIARKPAPGGKRLQPLPECDIIASWGEGKPVTLVYTKTVDLASYGTEGGVASLNDAANDKGLYDLLKSQLPPLGVKIAPQTPLSGGASYPNPPPDPNVLLLKLQRVARVQIDFEADGQAIATS